MKLTKQQALKDLGVSEATLVAQAEKIKASRAAGLTLEEVVDIILAPDYEGHSMIKAIKVVAAWRRCSISDARAFVEARVRQ